MLKRAPEYRRCDRVWALPQTRTPELPKGRKFLHRAFRGNASYRPSTFADPANSFHEKAAFCRAAEYTCYFATVNYASDGSPTTSAVVKPDGTLLCYQPYGLEGLLIANIDISEAMGLLARRWKDI